MKKILLTAMMCLLISGSCFANGVASIFTVEETIGDKVAEVFFGKGDFKSIAAIIDDDLKKNFTSTQVKELRSSIASNFGAVYGYDLIGYNRGVDSTGRIPTDNVDYLVSFANGRKALLRVAVVNRNNVYKIGGFTMGELTQAQPGNAPAK